MPAIVLCGGASRRMGRDKNWLMLRRVVGCLEGRFSPIVLVRFDSEQKLPKLKCASPVIVAQDVVGPGAGVKTASRKGPAWGLYSGLRALQRKQGPLEWLLLVSNDCPTLQPDLLQQFCSISAEVPEDTSAILANHHQHPQFFPCLVHGSQMESLKTYLESGQRSLKQWFEMLSCHRLEPEEWQKFDPDGASFRNLNTEEQWRAFRNKSSE